MDAESVIRSRQELRSCNRMPEIHKIHRNGDVHGGSESTDAASEIFNDDYQRILTEEHSNTSSDRLWQRAVTRAFPAARSRREQSASECDYRAALRPGHQHGWNASTPYDRGWAARISERTRARRNGAPANKQLRSPSRRTDPLERSASNNIRNSLDVRTVWHCRNTTADVIKRFPMPGGGGQQGLHKSSGRRVSSGLQNGGKSRYCDVSLFASYTTSPSSYRVRTLRKVARPAITHSKFVQQRRKLLKNALPLFAASGR